MDAVLREGERMIADRSKKAVHSLHPSSGSAGGVIVSGLIGLVLGVLFAAGVVWYLTQSSSFDLNRVLARPTDKPIAGRGQKKENVKPVAEKGYGFYDMLSKGRDAAALTAPPKAGTRRPELLYLQVGAFERPAEADNMRALLALNGIEASAQRTKLGDGRTVHRVRVGPFSSQEEMISVQTRLTAAGVTFISASQPR